MTVADGAVTYPLESTARITVQWYTSTCRNSCMLNSQRFQSSKCYQWASAMAVGGVGNRCTTWGIWRDRTTRGFSVTFLGFYIQIPVPDD
ncbi:hypothetical protein I79_002294 [Cricetulus griseus]|uniref:Uncharacterized protein n=1 Tax=Cricetulus griseus TaxID=10029 RepID=G3GX07_CRIGR|nr:hypothetical protein I79_002294 [Cricetulus griseus]